jgi:hypothetical protein
MASLRQCSQWFSDRDPPPLLVQVASILDYFIETDPHERLKIAPVGQLEEPVGPA